MAQPLPFPTISAAEYQENRDKRDNGTGRCRSYAETSCSSRRELAGVLGVAYGRG